MTAIPVSSSTSRTAATTMGSPGSALPLGHDQSRYRGRWTMRTSMSAGSTASPTTSTRPGSAKRQTSAPAERTSFWGLGEGVGVTSQG